MIKRYNVAISMDFTDAAFGGIFTNGLRQNNIFLYRMFKASNNCANVWLLNVGAPEYKFPDGVLGVDPDAIVRFDQIKDELDYLLVVGTRPGPDQVKYLRDRGCKIIFYKGGNSAILSMEAVADSEVDKYGEFYFDVGCYDTMWMTPQHIRSYAGWAKTMYRIDVHEVPQVWDSSMMDLQDDHTRNHFGYRKKKKGEQWKIGVTDPNITVMKTVHMPALVCEAAYRKRPAVFDKIHITNSLQFMQNPHFKSFMEALSSARAGVMTVEQRFMLYDFLAKHVHAIVTHHWENGLNYLYYEVLYGNYPLIHNSEFLKDYGYYYKDFDAEDGARALLAAIKDHDRSLKDYAARNGELFARLDPQSIDNIRLHEKLMFAL
jgi:hypothetical protein